VRLTRSNEVPPAHCDDDNDNRVFAGLVGEECSDALHIALDRAWSNFAQWFVAVTQEINSSSAIRPLQVAHPSRPTGLLALPVTDPTVTLAMVAQAAAEHGSALYVGLVTRGLDGRWRGLTGYFVPSCTRCDPTSSSLTAKVVEVMPADGRSFTADTLPRSLRPRGGWFDDRLITAVQLAPPRLPMAPWFGARTSADSGEEILDSPALIRVGPVTTSLTNLIFVDSARHELPDLAAHVLTDARDEPSDGTGMALSLRYGDREQLLSLCGGLTKIDATLSQIRPANHRVPIEWGVWRASYRDGTHAAGITRDLRRRVDEIRRANLNPSIEIGAARGIENGRGVICWRAMTDLYRVACRLPEHAAVRPDSA
jgi:hypothetical protein